MVRDLYDLEERIMNFLEKETNLKKSFSLLFIANRVDPKGKMDYASFETILNKLELEGTLYHNADDTWCLFPFEKDIIQGTVKKNEKGTAMVDFPDGRKFLLKPEDAGYLLNGDIITFKPTSKTSGSRTIVDIDKIIKRKNGLVAVRFTRTGNGYLLEPLTTKLSYPICLPERDLEYLENYDELLIKIDELNYAGVLEAELIDRIYSTYNRKEIQKDLSNDSENEEVEYYEDEPEIVEEKEEVVTSPKVRKHVNTPVIEDTSLDTYIKNAKKAKLETQLLDYTVKGILSINRFGEGIVEVNDKKYLLRNDCLGDALNGDEVEIRPSKAKSHGYIVSRVENVIKRKNGYVTVEISQDKKGEITIVPISADLKHKLVLPEDFDKPLVAGDRLVVQIDEEPKDGHYEIKFVRSIGHKDDPDIDVKTIAAENEITIEFTQEQMDEANSLPTSVSPEEKVGRLDYTKKKVFTIDGARTKDRDDALSIEELDNGNYLVGIHIADVTHYIKPGMALWNAIVDRATSVYMTDTVIPMLPHIISNGICSLNPGVDRLTLSCMVELNPQGEVVNFDFKDVVINSDMAMTYDDVNEVLEEGNTPEGYEDYVPELTALNKLSKKLSEKRMERGAVDFSDIESDTEIEYDKNNLAYEFNTKKQRSAEELIENFMLLAGECYANYMMVPTTYRVHEAPDIEPVEEAFKEIKKLGVKVKDVKDVLNGSSLTKVINSIKDKDVRTLAANIILRSMKRARIDVDPTIGHYALAEEKICRFTSPIRRAEDAIAHYQLRKQRDNLYNSETFDSQIEEEYAWIKEESDYITQKQMNADKAEKDAIHLKMAQFIDRHIGATFAARVTSVNQFGIYIKTANGVIGKIDPSDYQDDFLIYDDSTLSYKGRKTGVIVTVGTLLNVIALDTHREYKTINFGVSHQQCKKLVLKKGAA